MNTLPTHFDSSLLFFFFNDTATTEIYTLSLHDALPILRNAECGIEGDGSIPGASTRNRPALGPFRIPHSALDRKSTRLNSSHQIISYAVFCLKKKKKKKKQQNYNIINKDLHKSNRMKRL